MKKVNSNLGTNEAYGINTARVTNAEMLNLFPRENLIFWNEDELKYYYADGSVWLTDQLVKSVNKNGNPWQL